MAEGNHAAWEDMAPGIAQKLLYTHPASGARALLLRSRARPRTESSGHALQYHPVNEEFLCLDGRFTLEGTHWLAPLTYVFYPAGLVHGFQVDVPEGYEIYLRNSGPFAVEWVATPARNGPYLIDDPETECPGVIIADCAELVRDAAATGQLAVITLRSSEKAEGALIACLPPGETLELPAADADASIEIFVVQGEIQRQVGAHLGQREHGCATEPEQLRNSATEPAIVMLNYQGQGLEDAITSQAQWRRQASNAYL